MDGSPAAIVYNVGGGSETSLNGAIEMCERLAGERLKVIKRVQLAGMSEGREPTPL
jgi:hypothetical protein